MSIDRCLRLGSHEQTVGRPHLHPVILAALPVPQARRHVTGAASGELDPLDGELMPAESAWLNVEAWARALPVLDLPLPKP